MSEEQKESQYARRKRLAAEKAAKESGVVANPFAQPAGSEPSTINESFAQEEQSNSDVQNPGVGTYDQPTVGVDAGDMEDDWLEDFGKGDSKVVAEISGSTEYEPIQEGCIFGLNYKESNVVSVRPYPLMLTREKSLSMFSSISTLINDPSGKGDPIFNEISPRITGARDEVLMKMLNALKGDPDLRKACVRTIDNKYILCQIIQNKNNPETIGKFVLFRLSYSLAKVMTENGLIDRMNDLVNPSNNKVIVVDMTYDESRNRKIEYKVSVQTCNQGTDKLVQQEGGAYTTVGNDLNAFKVWKTQFYAAFKECKKMYSILQHWDESKFTTIAAEEVLKKFQQRYQEVNAAIATSIGTAAEAIANGMEPAMQAPNPFAASPSAAAPSSNPFVSNMNAAAPANPFGAAPSNPFAAQPGGFNDIK